MVTLSIVTGTNLFLFVFWLKWFGMYEIQEDIPESELCFCFCLESSSERLLARKKSSVTRPLAKKRRWTRIVACSTLASVQSQSLRSTALRAIWAQPATKATIFWNIDSYSLVWIDRMVRLEMYKTWFSDLIKLKVRFIYIPNLASPQRDLVLSKKEE